MKVWHFPVYPLALSYGGFEIQMEDVIACTRAIGIDAEIASLSRSAKPDLVHFWGFENQHSLIASALAAERIPYVVTGLVAYDSDIRIALKKAYHAAVPAARHLQRFVASAAGIVAVNECQKRLIDGLFARKAGGTVVIPNQVPDRFWRRKWSGGGGYILCTGNICRRKRQLEIARACTLLSKPLILVGGVGLGEDSYAKEVHAVCHGNIQWRGWLDRLGDEYGNLLEKADAVIVASRIETQPINLLEAAAIGAPIIVNDAAYAYDPLYAGAQIAPMRNVTEIMNAITSSGLRKSTPLSTIADCRPEAVARAHAKLYDVALGAQGLAHA